MRILILTLTTFLWLISLQVSAGEIRQVKGKKALIIISPGEFQVGDEVFSVGADGKKKGLLKITQIKGDKALANIVKGAAAAGHGLQLKLKPIDPAKAAPEGSSGDEAEEAASSEPSTRSKPPFGFMKRGKSAMGVTINQATNKLAITATSSAKTESINLAGSSVGLAGFIDLQATKSMNWRVGLGYQTFDGTGSTATPTFCSGSTSCSLAISYLTTEGWLQFSLFQTKEKMRFWAGIGGEFMIALSKKNSITALSTTDSTNYFLFLSLGGDIALDKESAIPISFDYALQPTSSPGAKASLSLLRIGYLWRY